MASGDADRAGARNALDAPVGRAAMALRAVGTGVAALGLDLVGARALAFRAGRTLIRADRAALPVHGVRTRALAGSAGRTLIRAGWAGWAALPVHGVRARALAGSAGLALIRAGWAAQALQGIGAPCSGGGRGLNQVGGSRGSPTGTL